MSTMTMMMKMSWRSLCAMCNNLIADRIMGLTLAYFETSNVECRCDCVMRTID